MIDELRELRQANPHHPEDLTASVAVSRDDFIAAVRADTSSFPLASSLLDRAWRRPVLPAPGRLGWAGALAAIVLAVVVAFGQMNSVDVDTDVVDAPTTPSELPSVPTTVAEVGLTGADAAPSDVEGSIPASTEVTPPSTPVAAPTSGPSTAAAPATVPTTVPATTNGAPTSSPDESGQPPTLGLFRPGVDLLAVHLDFAHTDDGLAALATREVTEWFTLDPLVVAGTASPAATHRYDEIMTAAWGSSWVDAALDRTAAVELATARWLAVLDNGGDVWVAEGGVSDFSAEVLRDIRSARPGLDISSRIHVIQHSQRNEDETQAVDLAEIVSSSDYSRIDDGNSTNDTADLNMTSEAFEAAARTGPRAAAWSAGFAYHPASGLDFSDTVAVLHILGIGTDQVADPSDFASRFMSGS